MNLDTDLIFFTKINSKWIIDLNVKHKTIKTPRSKGRRKVRLIFRYGDDVFNTIPKAQTMREEIDKLSSFQSYEPQHTRLPCPSPTPGVHPNYVHCVGDAIQPSHPLSSPSPPALNLYQHQGLFK